MSNFISCFGSEPLKGVLAQTCMIHDFRDTLSWRFDRQTLQVTFPQALDNMLGDRQNDCIWEFYKSNQIQMCRINYMHNIVTSLDNGTQKPFTRGKGIIILNSRLELPFIKIENEGQRYEAIKREFVKYLCFKRKMNQATAEKEYDEKKKVECEKFFGKQKHLITRDYKKRKSCAESVL